MSILKTFPVNKRAFVSTARMIMFPLSHLGADTDYSNSHNFLQETLWEISEAQKVINLILLHNGLKIFPVKGDEVDGWELPDVQGRWDMPGDEVIIIPALSCRYRSYFNQ